MTTFQDSRRLTPASIHNEKLIGSNGIFSLIYFSNAKFDAAPDAQEVFVNAVPQQRLYLPPDSIVSGTASFVAWNTVTSTAAAAIARTIDFVAINDDGTLTFDPIAPAVRVTKGPGTLELVLDQANKAVRVDFTGAANASYLVRGRIDIIASGVRANEFSNYFTNVT